MYHGTFNLRVKEDNLLCVEIVYALKNGEKELPRFQNGDPGHPGIEPDIEIKNVTFLYYEPYKGERITHVWVHHRGWAKSLNEICEGYVHRAVERDEYFRDDMLEKAIDYDCYV